MADTTIPDNALTTIVDALDRANARVAAQFPGDSPAQQPVHTVSGGAHLFKADAAAFASALGLDASVAHRPARYRPRARPPIINKDKADAAAFASTLGLDASVAHRPARYRPRAPPPIINKDSVG